jgi:hypothetical protein
MARQLILLPLPRQYSRESKLTFTHWVSISPTIDKTMGIHRLFTRGGQNFPGGQTHIICPKNALKHTIFFQKSQKAYYLDRPRGGASAPSCPSLHTPMDKTICFKNAMVF